MSHESVDPANLEVQLGENESSVEFRLAGETLALKALMIAHDRRVRQFNSKRAGIRAEQAHKDFPHLRMSKSQLKNVIRALDKKCPPSQHLDTDSFLRTEPVGIPGDESVQSMYGELDKRAMPSQSEIVDRARLRIYCLAGSVALDNSDAQLVYDITATRLATGMQTATVYDNGELLTDDALFAPLGFVLAAKKQYE